MLLYILLAVLFVLIITVRWKDRGFHELSKIFKHDIRSLPILGVSHIFLGNDEDRMKSILLLGREILKQNGILFAWFAHYPFVVVGDPELAEFLVRNCLEKHSLMVRFLNLFFRTGSIIAPVPQWRHRRKTLVPIFSPKNLKRFVNIFAERSEVLVDQLKPTVGKPISIFDYISKYAIESVCETTIGVQINAQKSAEPHPFITSLQEVLHLLVERGLQPWLHSDFVYKLLPKYKTVQKCNEYIHGFIEQAKYLFTIIQSQKTQLRQEIAEEEFLQKSTSLLELMINADQGYTDKELSDEAITIIVAGTDTSVVGVSFTFLMLARHPDVQEKIFEELNQVFEDNTQSVTVDHLPQLKYLEAVIRESLRLYPPAPGIARIADQDVMLPSGVVLPKGCGVAIHLWAINRNPRYWGDDAEEFRPERFLEGLKNPAQFATFSIGSRNCIGYQYALMSMKTALSTLLRHYRVTPADPTKIHEPIRLNYAMMMKDVNNFMVKLEPRF